MSLRWTDQEFEDWRQRKGAHAEKPVQAVRSALERQGWKDRPKTPQAGIKATKPRRDAISGKRGMNEWEREFAAQLEVRKQDGEILWWGFEPIRIRLASGAWYKPDFVTVDKQHRTEVYEVKGLWREAARVRFKVAVEKLPYQFYIVRLHKGELRVTKV